MATTFDLKVKTIDANSKATTKTFSKVDDGDTDTAKVLANAYAALTDYATKSAQTVKYTDVDLDD